jgi:hypothetical protein
MSQCWLCGEAIGDLDDTWPERVSRALPCGACRRRLDALPPWCPVSTPAARAAIRATRRMCWLRDWRDPSRDGDFVRAYLGAVGWLGDEERTARLTFRAKVLAMRAAVRR